MNTLQMFKAAAESNGLERRCLQTMVHVEYSRYIGARQKYARPELRAVREYNDQQYDAIVQNINRAMHTCL